MEERGPERTGTLLLWAVLALPGLWLVGRWAAGALGYGEVVSRTGAFALVLLGPATAVTPLRWLAPGARWVAWLAARRGEIGAAAFAYAGVHAAAYVIGKREVGLIWAEAAQPWLLMGWVALGLFALFAATDDDEWVARAVRRTWRWLHRSERASGALGWVHRGLRRWHRVVYLGAGLAMLHWLAAAFDPLTERVQVQLRTYGYYEGPVDGVIGPRSREALARLQHDHRLPITGTITREVLAVMGISPD